MLEPTRDGEAKTSDLTPLRKERYILESQLQSLSSPLLNPQSLRSLSRRPLERLHSLTRQEAFLKTTRNHRKKKKKQSAMPPSWPRRQQQRPSSAAANAAVFIDDDPDHAAAALHFNSNVKSTTSAAAAAVLSAGSSKSASPAVSSGRKTSRLVAACFGRRGGGVGDDLSPAGKAEAHAAAEAAAAEAEDDFHINKRSLSNASGVFNNQPSSSFPSPPTPLVLLTTVDVGGGRVESVTVSDGDDVEAAAEAFCSQHSLPIAVAAPLAAHLAENLLAARRARAASRRRTTMEAAAATAAWNAHGEEGAGPNPIMMPPPPRALLAAAATAEESAALQGKRFDFDLEGDEEGEAEAAAAATDSQLLPLAAAPASTRGVLGEEVAAAEEVGIVAAAVRNEHTVPSAAAVAAAATSARAAAAAARRAASAANAPSSSQQQPSKMTWVSAQLASGRSKGPYESYTHRLYAEGLEAIKARAAAAEAAAARKEEAELDGATWTPSIRHHHRNRNSSDASASKGTNNAWERLSATPLRKAADRDRLERLREERLEAETAECSFAPAVSKGTRRIIAAREEARGSGAEPSNPYKNRGPSLYESLYHDAERRRVRAAQEEEAAYAPWTTKKATATVASSNGDGREKSGKNKNSPPAVALRLLARRARVDARLAAERDAAERRPVDPRTGRPLFVPSVGRPPSDVPSSSSLSSASISASLSSSRSG